MSTVRGSGPAGDPGGQTPGADFPATSRRARAMPLVWSVVASTACVVAYFVLPFDSPLTGSTVVVLLGGVVAVVALLVWQIRQIAVSEAPQARAVSTMILVVPLYLIVFSLSYYLMSRTDPSNWSEPLSRLDAAYFTITTFATVGFGDIFAASSQARAVVTGQMVGNLVLIGLVTRVIVEAAQRAVARQRAARRE